MIYKERYEMIDPKGDFVERFWKVTLPRYRRRKKMKAALLSIAVFFLIFALILFFRTSFVKEDIITDDIWSDTYALIENEPNFYNSEVIWISKEDIDFYNQINDGNK